MSSKLIRSAAVLCAAVSLPFKIYWSEISLRGDISYHSYVEVHLEVDQPLNFLNFSLCYLSGLLAVNCYQPPTQPLCKAASFLLMLGSKSGFVRGFSSEALTQHEMSIEQAVPPSNHFLLFWSNITRWLLRLWTRFSVGNHPQLLHKPSLLKVLFLYTQDGFIQSFGWRHGHCRLLNLWFRETEETVQLQLLAGKGERSFSWYERLSCISVTKKLSDKS